MLLLLACLAGIASILRRRSDYRNQLQICIYIRSDDEGSKAEEGGELKGTLGWNEEIGCIQPIAKMDAISRCWSTIHGRPSPSPHPSSHSGYPPPVDHLHL